MIHTEKISRVQEYISNIKESNKIVGFVPTMGALHVGHISLIEAAKKQTDFIVVSIFVNPTQFGPSEDFDNYPRPIDKDLKICEENGIDLVFIPKTNEMYPNQNITWVNVEKLTDKLCGKSRPGHFKGVTTVCAKLFNIVAPDKAFFGQKDAQQAVVIKRMVKDLNMPLEIVACPTVREPDGLAVSSRNKYLTDAERKDAPLIFESLQKAKQSIASGHTNSKKIIEDIKAVIGRSEQFQIEYIELLDAETLEDLTSVNRKVLIAIAARLGKARLIDNIIVDVGTD